MSLVPWLLRIREYPLVQRAERLFRSLPPVDRAAKRVYARHKRRALEAATRDPAVRAGMRDQGPLPRPFAEGMDERIVEYPWVLSHLPPHASPVLDAGSTLNYPWVADHPDMDGRDVIVYTLGPEGVLGRRSYSYLYGDLRATLLRDDSMQAIVCLSTLEHIGMDNRAYTGDVADADHDRHAYRDALRELRRLLRPGAPLLLTVPFGQRQDVGWLQQFDADGIDDIIHTFDGQLVAEHYFRHRTGTGWQRASRADCADARFVYRTRGGRSLETRATGLACLELRKPG